MWIKFSTCDKSVGVFVSGTCFWHMTYMAWRQKDTRKHSKKCQPQPFKDDGMNKHLKSIMIHRDYFNSDNFTHLFIWLTGYNTFGATEFRPKLKIRP